jgi:hypothetical protein
MASLTTKLETKRKRRNRRMGRKRKNKLGRHSTLSYSELFAALGEPKG